MDRRSGRQLWEPERGARPCPKTLPSRLREERALGILSEDETHRS